MPLHNKNAISWIRTKTCGSLVNLFAPTSEQVYCLQKDFLYRRATVTLKSTIGVTRLERAFRHSKGVWNPNPVDFHYPTPRYIKHSLYERHAKQRGSRCMLFLFSRDFLSDIACGPY